MKEKRNTTSKTPSGAKAQKKSTKGKRIASKIKKELQVVAIDGDFYKTKDGDYMEILKIKGTSGVKRFSPAAQEALITEYTAGLRTFTRAFNLLILDFLVDHKEQIEFYQYKIDQLDLSNPVEKARHYWLVEEVRKLEYRQQHVTEEQYFLVLFGASKDELMNTIRAACEVAYLHPQQISLTAKNAIIYQINNLNSSAYHLIGGYPYA